MEFQRVSNPPLTLFQFHNNTTAQRRCKQHRNNKTKQEKVVVDFKELLTQVFTGFHINSHVYFPLLFLVKQIIFAVEFLQEQEDTVFYVVIFSMSFLPFQPVHFFSKVYIEIFERFSNNFFLILATAC